MLGTEHAAYPGNRTARAHPGDEGVNLGELGDELARRRLPVNLRVRGVRELLRHVPVGILDKQLFRPSDGAVHALGVGAEDEAGTVRLEEGATLLAHRVGHRQHETVSLDGRHERQPDSRVAARRLDDRAARLEGALALRGFYHRAADAVLDTAVPAHEPDVPLCQETSQALMFVDHRKRSHAGFGFLVELGDV